MCGEFVMDLYFCKSLFNEQEIFLITELSSVFLIMVTGPFGGLDG